jgi:hypothetical protein
MPGVVKIGYTKKDPSFRLKFANSTFGIRPGWRIDVAKKVTNVHQKEALLHRILAPYNICDKDISAKEQFNVSVNMAAELIALMDGEIWTPILDRRVEPNEPFEGYVYNREGAIINGMRVDYKERSIFPPCRVEGCQCKVLNLKKIDFIRHVQDVDRIRRDEHNSKILPKQKEKTKQILPRPRVRVRKPAGIAI